MQLSNLPSLGVGYSMEIEPIMFIVKGYFLSFVVCEKLNVFIKYIDRRNNLFFNKLGRFRGFYEYICSFTYCN